MKVLINPKIIISEPVKNQCYGFKIVLTKKDIDELTVKAVGFGNKNRGIVGKITRGGHFVVSNKYKCQLPVITPSVQIKIDVLLDLTFGKTRDKKVKLCENGMVVFNKN